MTSVGPPAGNPTTTRTGRVGYPSAHDGTAPQSNRTTANIQRKTIITAHSQEFCRLLLPASSARMRLGTRANEAWASQHFGGFDGLANRSGVRTRGSGRRPYPPARIAAEPGILSVQKMIVL